MNRTTRNLTTAIRNYHVPHDKNPFPQFKREDNLFGEMQEFLSLQTKIKRVSINITNPNYVSKFCQENPALYSVDIHYNKSDRVASLEGTNCEDLVRQTLTFVRTHDEDY
jgi:hypothetical protein